MPDLHLIKLLLGIKDENIQITHVEKKKIHSINSIVVSATLIKTIHRCPQCKQVNQHGLIVKNGKKKSLVLLNKCANQRTYLALQNNGTSVVVVTPILRRIPTLLKKTVLSPNKYIIKYWRN